MNGEKLNVQALTDPTVESGVASGRVLLEFAAATVGSDDTELARFREALRSELGNAGVADAAAVTSNFERMVRIADSIGIELGDRLETATEAVRSELSLERLRSRPDDSLDACGVTNKTAPNDRNARTRNGQLHPYTPQNPPR